MFGDRVDNENGEVGGFVAPPDASVDLPFLGAVCVEPNRNTCAVCDHVGSSDHAGARDPVSRSTTLGTINRTYDDLSNTVRAELVRLDRNIVSAHPPARLVVRCCEMPDVNVSMSLRRACR